MDIKTFSYLDNINIGFLPLFENTVFPLMRGDKNLYQWFNKYSYKSSNIQVLLRPLTVSKNVKYFDKAVKHWPYSQTLVTHSKWLPNIFHFIWIQNFLKENETNAKS